MLWVLKRTVSLKTVSMRRFFEHPKHMFKLMGKTIITILRLGNFTYLDLFIVMIPHVPSIIFQLCRAGSSWVEPVLS